MGSKYTPAQRRASDEYQKKLASISIRLKPDIADKYKFAAQRLNMSLREFVIASMDEKIQRDIGANTDGKQNIR